MIGQPINQIGKQIIACLTISIGLGLNFNLACKLTGFANLSLNPHHLRISCSAINDLCKWEKTLFNLLS